MTDYSNIDAKLEEYSEVFDIYLDGGELPPTDGQDPLRDYIVSVILTCFFGFVFRKEEI